MVDFTSQAVIAIGIQNGSTFASVVISVVENGESELPLECGLECMILDAVGFQIINRDRYAVWVSGSVSVKKIWILKIPRKDTQIPLYLSALI